MEVTVTRLYGPGDAGAGVEAVAGEDGGGAGWWGGEAPQLQSFNDLRALGVQGGLLRRMKKARLNRPTPIQSAAIPVLQSGRDLLLASPPGSGATAAYLIPLVQALLRVQRRRTRNRAFPTALVLAPSRELAQQVGLLRCAAGAHARSCVGAAVWR
ncbi:ATP-dependent RNA helicase [Monoraphidium neglectum]|uniref:ATP-dependent RNA helicase n=1 Tax=Monoraphidium neglectum TaxID=145388 RepID=A0A0D2MI56_9CHLO|nr:ATP-dependent RNA helicase [Monoraphidium neglectum]KIZ02700.1 ATP-dependent RNA helicase [Monoraphidium neglectum]|eukprot:XP_013901719.1 ATP-dependent RNA helicase [Monoraphidium neglectum]